MGLAERFKDRLAKRDIFTKNNEESYVSTPITQNITVQPKTLHSGSIVTSLKTWNLKLLIKSEKHHIGKNIQQ